MQGPLLDELPSGSTLRGKLRFSGHANSMIETWIVPMNFAFPLPTSSLVVNFGPSFNCPGSADMPEAAPGFFCLYSISESNVNFVLSVPDRFHAIATLTTLAIGTFSINGNWAATAP